MPNTQWCVGYFRLGVWPRSSHWKIGIVTAIHSLNVRKSKSPNLLLRSTTLLSESPKSRYSYKNETKFFWTFGGKGSIV